MTPIEVLKKAREFLSKPGAWCQGASYLDKRGRKCASDTEPRAACLYGACLMQEAPVNVINTAIFLLAREAGTPVSTYNDYVCVSAADAIALIDRTIAANEVP